MTPIHDTPIQQLDLVTDLYTRYGADLVRVQAAQRALYPTLAGYPMFGDREGEWLYLFTRLLGESGPVTALEVGAGCGWSSSWILRGLDDNQAGHLTSVDVAVTTSKSLHAISQARWTFLQRNVLTCLGDLPHRVDLLLIDASHDSPTVEQIHAAIRPVCRPGGITAVHDIYMLPHPRHSEAICIFAHLEAIGVRPFSPSPCFPDAWDAISQVRSAIGLGPNIHINEINSSLWYRVPKEGV